MGRVTSSQQMTSDETYTFAYAYNLAGALTAETYPSGRVVATGYDGANRVSGIAGNVAGQQTAYASGVSYAAQGAPSYIGYGNQVARSFTYTNRLSLSSYWDAFQNSPSNYLFAVQENWGTTNNNGNLLGETIWKGGPAPLSSMSQATRSYGYDTVNRLTAASDSSGWNRQFDYDAWGNMWVTANSGVNLAGNTPTANVYNSNNQTGGTSYDAAGNALSVNGFTLGYDAENRQVSATEQPSLGGGQELYLYDGNGQRVEKVSVGGNTIYVYDAFGQLAAEYNTFASSFACTTCYDTADQLGSVRMVTDQSGNAVTRHDYLPFGEEIAGSSPSMDVEQRFTGQIRDTETGMDFFNARYYTAPLGRFNSVDPGNAGADPSDPQSWNGYGYVRNNPMNSVDPSGACDVLGAGVTMAPGKSPVVDQFGADKISVFPYAGSGLVSGVVQAGTDGGDVPGLVTAIQAAISQTPAGESVNLFTISGAAQTLSLAFGHLSPDELSRIGNITYMIPGGNPLGGKLPTGNGTTTYITGGGGDHFVPSAHPPTGSYESFQANGCGHNPACVISQYAQLLKDRSGPPCGTSGTITPKGLSVSEPSKDSVHSVIRYGTPGLAEPLGGALLGVPPSGSGTTSTINATYQ